LNFKHGVRIYVAYQSKFLRLKNAKNFSSQKVPPHNLDILKFATNTTSEKIKLTSFILTKNKQINNRTI